MISSRKNNRNNSEKLNLERKVDQFIEVSRQFVDGVSGTRPGQRKSRSMKEFSKRNVNNVTQWVSKKVDSFFDDPDYYKNEDDWDDQFDETPNEMIKNINTDKNFSQNIYMSQKKPLTAISLREVETKPKRLKSSDSDWPEASDFQLDRWKRVSSESQTLDKKSNKTGKTNFKARNFPKSSRRRI